MQWADISFRPSSRTLRQFALSLVALLTGIGAWQALVRDNVALGIGLGVAGVVLGLAGWVCPRLLRPIFVSWMCVTFPIGWLVSQATLVLLFYGVFTPLGLVFRLLGRDVLARRRPEGYDTYWQPKPAAGDARSYFRQS